MNLQDETLYKRILERTHDGLIFKPEGQSFQVILVGDPYLQLTGLSRQLLTTGTLEELPAEYFPDNLHAILQAALSSGKETETHSFLQPNTQASGVLEVTFQAIPMPDKDGRLNYVHYRIHSSAQDSAMPMERSDAEYFMKVDEIRKNDFIAMVSHELKTPLTSLKAYVQLLRIKARNSRDTFTTNALSKADAQVNKMDKMIRSFLDISRLESGQIFLEKEVFTIDQLLSEVVEEVSLTDKTHSILFSACKPLKVHGDREKIGQVINNLLSNAMKYSSHYSKVTVRCEQVGSEVHISVIDEGVGLAKADIEKLFSRFYRVKNMQVKTVSGFGIGLYLSAEIIKKHGGKIWVESEENVGSVFSFSLPGSDN